MTWAYKASILTLHHYRIHGLNIDSAVHLPDARPGNGPGDVRITMGVPSAYIAHRPILVGDRTTAQLFLPEVATFDFEQGQRIHVTPHTDDPETLRSFLLGSAWAVLLHQRGILPLHGCGLEWGGAAWLFVGESGAGKSTLAAALLRGGASLLSDDVTAIDEGADGCGVWAGLRSMKLAPDAADHVPGSQLGPSYDGAKLRIVPDRLAVGDRVPLWGVVELIRAAVTSPELVRVRGSQACAIAIRHTFRGLAASRLGTGGQHLSACARLSGSVPFFRLARAWDLPAVEATARWLLQR
jgi:hypothetical protein